MSFTDSQKPPLHAVHDTTFYFMTSDKQHCQFVVI